MIQCVLEMAELGVPLHVIILTCIGGTTMSRTHAFKLAQTDISWGEIVDMLHYGFPILKMMAFTFIVIFS